MDHQLKGTLNFKIFRDLPQEINAHRKAQMGAYKDVRGLGNNAKGKEVFNWLRVKKQSIYMLQEFHCSEGTTNIWTCKWGYKALLAASKQGLVLF